VCIIRLILLLLCLLYLCVGFIYESVRVYVMFTCFIYACLLCAYLVVTNPSTSQCIHGGWIHLSPRRFSLNREGQKGVYTPSIRLCFCVLQQVHARGRTHGLTLLEYLSPPELAVAGGGVFS